MCTILMHPWLNPICDLFLFKSKNFSQYLRKAPLVLKRNFLYRSSSSFLLKLCSMLLRETTYSQAFEEYKMVLFTTMTKTVVSDSIMTQVLLVIIRVVVDKL